MFDMCRAKSWIKASEFPHLGSGYTDEEVVEAEEI
jgi:hypothetical protein